MFRNEIHFSNRRFVLGLLVFALLAMAAVPTTKPAQFAAVVEGHFDQWDLDHNGELSADEIDRLVRDGDVKGDEAGAAAALKIVLRGGRYIVPPLTREYFDNVAKRAATRPTTLT